MAGMDPHDEQNVIQALILEIGVLKRNLALLHPHLQDSSLAEDTRKMIAQKEAALKQLG